MSNATCTKNFWSSKSLKEQYYLYDIARFVEQCVLLISVNKLLTIVVTDNRQQSSCVLQRDNSKLFDKYKRAIEDSQALLAIRGSITSNLQHCLTVHVHMYIR
jgi:hypothetical protein